VHGVIAQYLVEQEQSQEMELNIVHYLVILHINVEQLLNRNHVQHHVQYHIMEMAQLEDQQVQRHVIEIKIVI